MLHASQMSAYPPETAGAVMTDQFVAITADFSIRAALRDVATAAATKACIDYVYIVDELGGLSGVVSLRELLRAAPDDTVAKWCDPDTVSVDVLLDQERIVHLAAAYNIKAVPVVGADGVLVGVVTTDQLLQIINAELHEDLLHISGTTPKNQLVLEGVAQYIRPQIIQRLPWLLIGLAGGTLAAFVVGYFEFLLAEYVVLAAFIPLIVYMADAVGAQIQLLFIRRLTVDPHVQVGHYFKQEGQITVVIALVLALVMAGVTAWWTDDRMIAIVLSLSVLATTLMAMTVAIVLPWLFTLVGRDPAVASGPFGTVVIDILSLLIYFGVASLLLGL